MEYKTHHLLAILDDCLQEVWLAQSTQSPFERSECLRNAGQKVIDAKAEIIKAAKINQALKGEDGEGWGGNP